MCGYRSAGGDGCGGRVLWTRMDVLGPGGAGRQQVAGTRATDATSAAGPRLNKHFLYQDDLQDSFRLNVKGPLLI